MLAGAKNAMDYKDPRFTAQGAYHKVSALVRDWLIVHQGENFNLDTICRQLEINERENRKYVAIELSRQVDKEKVEKVSTSRGPIYKYINKEIKEIDWLNASVKDEVKVKFPYSHTDSSYFEFAQRIIIRPADLIVIAGVSNKGKSVFCRNLLWENMDNHSCLMMVNEYAPGRFKSVTGRMNWNSPLNGNGEPKFKLVERHEDWKYAVDPDGVNIIDWISLADKFWQIRDIMEGIQNALRGGIAVIVLQKRTFKELGEGGGASEDRATLYLNIDSSVLTVRKAKEFRGLDPNGWSYGFDIVNGGAGFEKIRPVVKCKICKGTGERWVKGEGQTYCSNCLGSGWTDK